MKARKFIKRDRTTIGRATGTIRCRLFLPATDDVYDLYTTPLKHSRAIGSIRKFVERHLPENPDLLIGAKCVIEAEIRASVSRLGRKRLATWNYGDSLSLTLEKALHEWESLEFEDDDYKPINVEI